jgi:3'-phosphoadenosine 5'-phosphosulfate sulfotransferase (PAPS reductase)/FAD synthetase
VLVAYSGGKDSLACLDLAVSHYGAARVEAFFMYFLPGLDYSRVVCDYAAERWGVRVRQRQHWLLAELLRDGVFCQERPDCPRVGITDVEAAIRLETGKRWIAIGYKKVDSLERRGMLMADWPDGINPTRGAFAPIAEWTSADVRAYLRRQRIVLPGASSTFQQFGVTLAPDALHWLRQWFPQDYERVLKVFPYAAAQADRHEQFRRAAQDQRAALRARRRRAQPDPAGSLQPERDRGGGQSDPA